ncbi:MAG: uracil phosphoribosyltransferase [Planctomycetes bacterium]|nr:uracil phosphoribosyltransferase [Planctomycetota bacterium]
MPLNTVDHAYGERVCILDNPWMNSALARLGQADTSHTELMYLLRSVYMGLGQVAYGARLPSEQQAIPTRMNEAHPKAGIWVGRGVDPSAKVVVLDVIRGGMVPSQVCFELLTAILPVENLRLDHLNMARQSDAQGHVVGVDLTGSKVGGRLEGATLVLPDPMGATGGTLVTAIEYLIEHHRRPDQILALPMIATPEFLRTVLEAFDNVWVYAARLDRGLSPPDVLETRPGTHWEREKGLNEHSYIVPGAGGLGEVLNNSWC